MTAEELRIVRSDLHTKRRYNLTDEEFEDYIERWNMPLGRQFELKTSSYYSFKTNRKI